MKVRTPLTIRSADFTGPLGESEKLIQMFEARIPLGLGRKEWGTNERWQESLETQQFDAAH